MEVRHAAALAYALELEAEEAVERRRVPTTVLMMVPAEKDTRLRLLLVVAELSFVRLCSRGGVDGPVAAVDREGWPRLLVVGRLLIFGE